MSATAEVLSLAELAVLASIEHAAYETTQRAALSHAVAAGEALIEAKARLKHGEWLPWVRDNLDFSERTASRYMTIASNRTRVADLGSVREAIAELTTTRARTPRLEWLALCRSLVERLGDRPGPSAEREAANYAAIAHENPRWAGGRAATKVREAIEAVAVLPPDSVLRDQLDAIPRGHRWSLNSEREVRGQTERLAVRLEQLAADLRARVGADS